VESVRTTGRNTRGVRVMNLRGADKVSSMARVVSTTSTNGADDGEGKGLDGLGESEELEIADLAELNGEADDGEDLTLEDEDESE
jgi:DNA gyrase/topoisomerase IV subunit A